MLIVEDVSKSYGNHIAVEGVSFTVKAGETVGLLGANGAGKSTILNIISTYFSPNKGSVVLNGNNSVSDSLEYKQNLGYLPEIPPLYLEMTAREQLEMVCSIKKIPVNRIKREVERISNLCQISNILMRRNRTMSKGYKQRIGLAQALIGNPHLLILDEPTAGLDPQQIVEFRQIIQGLSKEQMLIISSHILSEVSAVSSRVIVLKDGLIVADSPTEKLENPTSDNPILEARILGERNIINSIIERIDGVEFIESHNSDEPGCFDYTIFLKKGCDIRKSLFQKLSDDNLPLMELKMKKPTLEDFFIGLISRNQE